MSVLAWIIATSVAGGLLSVAAAALFALNARDAHVPLADHFAAWGADSPPLSLRVVTMYYLSIHLGKNAIRRTLSLLYSST